MSYKVRNYIEFSFVALQTALYAGFLSLDITDTSIALSNYIKFCIIILCFCYAFFLGRGADKSILFCMKTALLFTVVSDLFLLLLDQYFWGVTTFIIVQQLYSLRLILTECKIREKGSVNVKQSSGGEISEINNEILKKYGLRLLIHVILSGLIYIILNKEGVILDGLLLVSVFYFVCITTNTVSAVKSASKNSNNRANFLYAIGMVLFLLCDINVGIFNLSGFITLPEQLYHSLYSLSSILMWTFYAPAQVLISLSVTKMSTKVNSVQKQSI